MTDTTALLRGRYGLDMPSSLSLNPAMKGILGHRSCRSYTDKAVVDDILELLLNLRPVSTDQVEPAAIFHRGGAQ